jgi:transcriptional regulator with XRE-family HTH domain
MLKANKNLKILRIKHGLSQKELSDLIFVDQATYSRIEGGKTELKLDTACAIAKELEVNLEDFCQINGQIIHIANNTFNQSSIYGDIHYLSNDELILRMKNSLSELNKTIDELNSRLKK